MSTRFSIGPSRLRELALDAWVVVPVVLLLWPSLVGGGYPLARDLVFTPRPPFTLDTLGLGAEPPRAVPLDAIVWLGSWLVGGAVLARVALLTALLLAGWGAHRVLPSAPLASRLLLGGLAVWNPFTVERLALGQWALLLGYAALWWLLPAVVAALVRRDAPALGRVALWTALASVTPTGGVAAVLVVLVTVLVRGRDRCGAALVALALVIQLPWILPGLLGASAQRADPDGIAAFAARAESGAGVFVSLLGLGGIWDGSSVPASREGAVTVVTAVLLVGGFVALAARSRSRRELAVWREVLVLGAIGLAMAGGTSVPVLGDGLAAMMDLPGVALLRDAQKWVLLLAPLAFTATAMLLSPLARQVRLGVWPAVWVLSAMCLPFLLIPDGAHHVSSTLRPVRYPPDFADIRRTLDGGHDGAVLVLPWRSYRVFTWGNATSVYDPASRWFDREIVRDDTLRVGDLTVSGESRRARAVSSVARSGVLDPDAVKELRSAGIGWALVYVDDPASDDLELAGLRPVAGGRDVLLYSLGEADAVDGPGAAAVGVVVAGDGIVVLLLMASLGAVLTGRRRVIAPPMTPQTCYSDDVFKGE
jgi:hypothetical protein